MAGHVLPDSFTYRPFTDIFTWLAMFYLTASHKGNSLIFSLGGHVLPDSFTCRQFTAIFYMAGHVLPDSFTRRPFTDIFTWQAMFYLRFHVGHALIFLHRGPCFTWQLHMKAIHWYFQMAGHVLPDSFTHRPFTAIFYMAGHVLPDSFTRRPFTDIFTWRAMFYLTASRRFWFNWYLPWRPSLTWQPHEGCALIYFITLRLYFAHYTVKKS